MREFWKSTRSTLPATPTQPDAVAALAELVHFGCVYVDGEAALRHQPKDHHAALEWALKQRPGWRLTNEPDATVPERTWREWFEGCQEARAQSDATVVALRAALEDVWRHGTDAHASYCPTPGAVDWQYPNGRGRPDCTCGFSSRHEKVRAAIYSTDLALAAQAAHDRIAAQARVDFGEAMTPVHHQHMEIAVREARKDERERWREATAKLETAWVWYYDDTSDHEAWEAVANAVHDLRLLDRPKHGDHPADSYRYEGCPGCAADQPTSEGGGE